MHGAEVGGQAQRLYINRSWCPQYYVFAQQFDTGLLTDAVPQERYNKESKHLNMQ